MSRGLRALFLESFIPALLGGAIGYTYGWVTLPPQLIKESSLAAMYAASGAAIFILSMRLSAIVRVMWNEYRSKGSGD